MAPLTAAVSPSLADLAGPAGAWGYAPGQEPQAEPTCLALLALRDRPDVTARAVAWLAGQQDPDGAWRVREGYAKAVWPTALAAFTLAALDVEPAARRRAVGWLLANRGQQYENSEDYARDFEIDPELAGWPWVAGTFSWVEPTAWACLALRRGGFGDHPRVAEGLRLLRDRVMDGGGVNVGNRKVFGLPTEPVPAVSALLLLAFAGLPDEPKLSATRAYLRGIVARDGALDLENLCWVRLAFAAWDGDPEAAALLPALAAQIRAALAARPADLFAPSVPRLALAELALAAERGSPFRWEGAAPPGEPPAAPAPQRPGFGERLLSFGRRMMVKSINVFNQPPQASAVHVAGVSGYEGDLAGVVAEQYAHFREQVPLKGKRVVLKPNLVEFHRGKVINTDPRVIAAVIELCRREGAAEVLVAEGPGHWRNTEYLVTASGLGEVLRHYQTPFVDLNHDELTRLANVSRCTTLEHLYFARTVATAEVLISLPKLKTHHWAGVTLSLKNLFGTLPGTCYGWPKNELHHRGIENSIVDIALTRKPDLALVDGVVGMEGDGPLNGTPKALGVLVMGTDPLAVDATCCRLMQLDPAKVGHLDLGARQKLGQLDADRIRQLGETVAARSQPFATIPLFRHLHAAERQARAAEVRSDGAA